MKKNVILHDFFFKMKVLARSLACIFLFKEQKLTIYLSKFWQNGGAQNFLN